MADPWRKLDPYSSSSPDERREPQASPPQKENFSHIFDEEEATGWASPPHVACPICKRMNPAAHRFCGFCGVQFRIPTEVSGSAPVESLRPQLVPRPLPTIDDLQFLRYRDARDNADGSSHRGWLFLVAGILFLIGSLFVFQKFYKSDSLQPAESITLTPVTSQPVPTAGDSQAASASSLPAPPDAGTGRSANESVPQGASATTAKVVVPAASTKREESTADNAPAGEEELKHAERLLAPDAEKNPRAAAKLLWKAVGKQNPQAALLLSDLYLRGDGVPKNCAQARTLLFAAAKRGAADAAQKLHITTCK